MERLGRSVNSVKDYNLKQSIIIIAAGCALLLVVLYLFTPILAGGHRDNASVTRLEEAQLADAINLYANALKQYPAGENASVTKALLGENPQHLIFLNLDANSTNQQGEVIDLWNTPYKITFNFTNSFTISSAGNDRVFGSTDDIVFDSRSNSFAKP